MSARFRGFSRQCLTFFEDLAQNNDKVWFEEHRDDFETHVMTPARAFVEDMGQRLRAIAPGVHAEPKVNRSLFRIYRDTRFSRDKSPYKTHLALWFWEGAGPRMECSGFYFHLQPPTLMLGAGIYCFPKHLLEHFREAAVHPRYGPALSRAAAVVIEAGYTLGGKHYKRLPRGFDPGHQNAALLLFNGLYCGWEQEAPAALYAPELIDFCYDHFKAMDPLHKWLFRFLEEARE